MWGSNPRFQGRDTLSLPDTYDINKIQKSAVITNIKQGEVKQISILITTTQLYILDSKTIQQQQTMSLNSAVLILVYGFKPNQILTIIT